MMIEKTTVTPEELRTIAHLNALVREEEVRQGALLSRGRLYDLPRHAERRKRRRYVCDACISQISWRCCNVVIDSLGNATMTVGLPQPDITGCVVLRYHTPHYPKNLVKMLNRPPERRGHNGVLETLVDLVEAPVYD